MPQEEFMNKAKIDRINVLARKAKREGLTPAEKAEQAALRQEFLANIRMNLRSQLDSIDMVLDGKFDAEEKEKNRRLLGSSNQRILCLTDRYKDDISWFDINKNGKAVEVNLSDRIVFNGDKI